MHTRPDFFHACAAEWWEPRSRLQVLNRLNPPRFAYFDRHLPDWHGLHVLDVGCGGGYSAEYLARRGALVAGVDVSTALIGAARRHARASGLAIDYRVAAAEALPYGAGSFDVVLCVDVLEHVRELHATVGEIGRVLKPGGLFLFDTINRTWRARLVMLWLLEGLLREIPHGVHTYQRFIRPEELCALGNDAGLGDFEFAGFDLFSRGMRRYRHYRRTGEPLVDLNDDMSVMYIGKARRAPFPNRAAAAAGQPARHLTAPGR